MILIVGLGNPGLKFKKTRHNLGFEILDRLKKEGEFSVWQNKKKLKSKISQGEIRNQQIILAKPQTFMNQSGQAVSRLMKFYKIPLKNLWIIHDDLDLAFGKTKIKNNSRGGGHKGVESIINELGTKNFSRLKIGIGPNPVKIDAKKFVLQKFTKDQRKILQTSQTGIVASLLTELNGGYKNHTNK